MSQAKNKEIERQIAAACCQAVAYLSENRDLNIESNAKIAAEIVRKAFDRLELRLTEIEEAMPKMPKQNNDELDSLNKRVAKLEHVLRKIAGYRGQGFGSSTGSQVVRAAHRDGSNEAFRRVAKIAMDALKE